MRTKPFMLFTLLCVINVLWVWQMFLLQPKPSILILMPSIFHLADGSLPPLNLIAVAQDDKTSWLNSMQQSLLLVLMTRQYGESGTVPKCVLVALDYSSIPPRSIPSWLKLCWQPVTAGATTLGAKFTSQALSHYLDILVLEVCQRFDSW